MARKDDPSARFNQIASNYAQSEVHAMSPSISRLHQLLDAERQIALCDVACGPGHLALSFSGRAGRIVGVDPAPNMLAAFRQLAEKRGVDVETVQAFAESIPLAGGAFDLVASRLAPHHFSNIERAVREMARLTRPGGAVAVIDLEGDPERELDEFNHELEILHDPTHFRSHTAARWRSLFEGAGLTVEVLERGLSERPGGVTVRRWCELASSGPDAEAEIRRLLSAAPAEVLEGLGITRNDHDFLMPVRTVLILGRKLPR